MKGVTGDGSDVDDLDAISMDAAYDDYPRIEEAFQELLDESLEPRGPGSLLELVAALPLPAAATVVDVGCGEGDDALALHGRLSVDVRGVDPVARHVELASAAAAAGGVSDRVTFELGSAEHIPVDDESVDLVWAKEMLMYADLDAAFAEFRRVLRPGAFGFVYQVLTGPEMTDEEGEAFWSADGLAKSVRPADIERAVMEHSLTLVERVDFGSEWGEYAQETSGAGGRRLVHAARLRRDPQRYIEAFGPTNYQIMLGDCMWHIYRMIGKLHGAAFVFQRDN